MTAPTETPVTRPDPYLTVKLGKEGVPKELFMSSALNQRLLAILDDSNFIMLHADAQLQTETLTEVFRPVDEKGRVDKDFSYETIQLDVEQANEVLAWVEAHLAYFFIAKAERFQKSLESPLMARLTQSVSGSVALMQEKQSAGPSE